MSSTRLRTTAAALLAALTTGRVRDARADCAPDGFASTCIAADTFWAHPGRSPFFFVGPADTVRSGAVDAGVAMTYLARPIVLNVPSADPAGAEFEAVGSVWDATLLAAFGVTSAIEVDVAMPFTLHRAGVGVSPLTDQRITSISGSSIGDVRFGGAFRLAGSPRAVRDASNVLPSSLGSALAGRLDVALPTGDESTFSGERTIVVAPALSFALDGGRWFAGAELGARLRGVSALAGSRVGPQVVTALGVGAELLPERTLSLSLEAIALPTTVAQHRLAYVASAGQREVAGSGPALVPAEWLASLRTVLASRWTASLGVGGALPLFGAADLTAPRFRFVLSASHSFDLKASR